MSKEMVGTPSVNKRNGRMVNSAVHGLHTTKNLGRPNRIDMNQKSTLSPDSNLPGVPSKLLQSMQLESHKYVKLTNTGNRRGGPMKKYQRIMRASMFDKSSNRLEQ